MASALELRVLLKSPKISRILIGGDIWLKSPSLLPPHSSLYSAMLLGNKSGLSQTDKDNLARAGLSHIVAISGMHIAVIALILFFVFLSAGMWRQHASIAVLLVLAFYIIMIGAPASAIRAGIMVSVLITAS